MVAGHSLSSMIGGPRGLLRLFVLHRLASRPGSGYDVICELNAITEGAWTPGSGSVYPILKELEREGLIEVVSRGGRSRQSYALTQRGEEALRGQTEIFNRFAARWAKIGQILEGLVSAERLPSLLDETLALNKVSWERVVASGEVATDEKVFRLKGYRLLLENQLEWVDEALKRFKAR